MNNKSLKFCLPIENTFERAAETGQMDGFLQMTSMQGEGNNFEERQWQNTSHYNGPEQWNLAKNIALVEVLFSPVSVLYATKYMLYLFKHFT
jgi:hypothetical protein